MYFKESPVAVPSAVSTKLGTREGAIEIPKVEEPISSTFYEVVEDFINIGLCYIKENNVWEKDPEREKVKQVIRNVAHKNFQELPIWKAKNPSSDDTTSNKHMEYMQILNEIVSGINPEDNVGLNKIIKKANYSFEYIDLGGGMGIDYKNNKKMLNLKNYSKKCQDR